ncbi:MAG: hypothetical protein QM754_15865 [Tepidisphaeraceae bacterium]
MALTPFTPRARDLLYIAAAAISLRAIVYLVITYKAFHGLSWQNIADLPYLSDGSAYIDNAKRINGDGMPNAYDQRVFVGFPWTIAMTHRLGVPYNAAAAILGLVLPGLLCAAAARWLRDHRIGWAMALLPPHWVLDTSAVMNESLMLLLCVLAMVLLRRQPWWGVAGAAMLFAAAGMVRPMACFATLGAIALLVQAMRPWRATAMAACTLASLAILFLAFRHFYWNPIDNARAYDAQQLAYNGQVFTYPFGSFVEMAKARGVFRPAFIYKAGYMVMAVAVAVAGLVVWWRRQSTARRLGGRLVGLEHRFRRVHRFALGRGHRPGAPRCGPPRPRSGSSGTGCPNAGGHGCSGRCCQCLGFS